MRTTMTLAIAVRTVTWSAPAAEVPRQSPYHLLVHFSSKTEMPANLLWHSQETATAVYAKIGVRLDWRSGHWRPPSKPIAACPDESSRREVWMEIVRQAPANLTGPGDSEALRRVRRSHSGLLRPCGIVVTAPPSDHHRGHLRTCVGARDRPRLTGNRAPFRDGSHAGRLDRRRFHAYGYCRTYVYARGHCLDPAWLHAARYKGTLHRQTER
jgi:hypothetical protein